MSLVNNKPFVAWQHVDTAEWFFQVWDYDIQTYRDHGPFETKDQAEEAGLRWTMHE